MSTTQVEFRDWLIAGGWDPADLSDGQRDTLLKAYTASADGGNIHASAGDRRQMRRDGIRDIAAKWTAQRPEEADLIDAMAREAEVHDLTPETFEVNVLRSLRGSIRTDPTLRTSKSSGPSSKEHLACAALLAAGFQTEAERIYGERVCTRAADMQIHSAVDLCRAALQADGATVPHSTDGIIRASISSYSLPIALGNSAEKLMAESFLATPATWRSWCGRKSVRNFKEHSSIRPYLSTGSFEEIATGGEIKHSAASEDVYTHSAKTYGKMFSVDRHDIINDDLGVVYELAREIGRQGVRKISDEVYKLLLSDAAASFFTLARLNYQEGADTALGATSLEAAIKMLREMVDADGMPISIVPKTLLVAPAAEFDAKQLITATTLDRTASSVDNAPTANPLLNVVGVEVEPRLSSTAISANASDVAWYLLGDPNVCPVVVVSFLNGVERPTIEQVDMPANILGLGFRGWIDFGVDFADYRGGVKTKGEA